MSEKIEKAVDKNEDSAILPFDEEEDNIRWAKLTLELEQIEIDVADYEVTHGVKILMNEPLREVDTEAEQANLGELF